LVDGIDSGVIARAKRVQTGVFSIMPQHFALKEPPKYYAGDEVGRVTRAVAGRILFSQREAVAHFACHALSPDRQDGGQKLRSMDRMLKLPLLFFDFGAICILPEELGKLHLCRHSIQRLRAWRRIEAAVMTRTMGPTGTAWRLTKTEARQWQLPSRAITVRPFRRIAGARSCGLKCQRSCASISRKQATVETERDPALNQVGGNATPDLRELRRRHRCDAILQHRPRQCDGVKTIRARMSQRRHGKPAV
jgi:hypothetical protein